MLLELIFMVLWFVRLLCVLQGWQVLSALCRRDFAANRNRGGQSALGVSVILSGMGVKGLIV
jgi:hypothetical protein